MKTNSLLSTKEEAAIAKCYVFDVIHHECFESAPAVHLFLQHPQLRAYTSVPMLETRASTCCSALIEFSQRRIIRCTFALLGPHQAHSISTSAERASPSTWCCGIYGSASECRKRCKYSWVTFSWPPLCLQLRVPVKLLVLLQVLRGSDASYGRRTVPWRDGKAFNDAVRTPPVAPLAWVHYLAFDRGRWFGEDWRISCYYLSGRWCFTELPQLVDPNERSKLPDIELRMLTEPNIAYMDAILRYLKDMYVPALKSENSVKLQRDLTPLGVAASVASLRTTSKWKNLRSKSRTCLDVTRLPI